MKSKIPKILFGLFVIGLIIYAVYYINNNENTKKDNNVEYSDIAPQIVSELRIGIAEFDTLNPILSQNKNVQEVSKLMYDSLVTLNNDYKAEPSLATEWSNIGNQEYIIKLREDVKFHDGSSFSADDVIFTMDKIRDGNINSIYKSNLQNVVSYETVDTYTVKLTLDNKVPFFEYNLTFPILSKQYYENQDFINTSKNNTPIGTGIYKIAGYTKDGISLKRNKDYWDNQIELENGIEKIEMYKYSSMGEVYNAFKIGNIDLVYTDNSNFENYIGTIGYNKKEYKGRQFDYLAFNNESNILSNVEMRKAISYAIDKSAINSSVFENKYYVADFPLDYNNWIYVNKSTSSGYNPDQVNTILSENGWELKNNVWQKKIQYNTIRANLNLVVNSSNEKRCLVAENIKQQLANVGINVTIKKASDLQYQNYLNNKNYDMILTGTNIGLSPNLSTYFGDGNYSKFSNEELRNILIEIQSISDENLLKEKYNKIYDIYKNQMPFISLYFNKNVVCYSPELMGDIQPNCFNLFYNVRDWYRQY